MRILITGGVGFVGTNLAADAIAQGHEVTLIDNFSRMGGEENLRYLQTLGRFQLHRTDVRDAASVARVVTATQPDALYHLAGQVAMTTSIEQPRLDFETNALGTLNVLEAVRAHSPKAHVLYSSTNKVYGDLEHFTYRETNTRYQCIEAPDGFDEGTPLDFRSPYGCSKGAAEQYVLDYGRVYGLRTTVFRHSSMYGGRQYASFDQGWLGWFASCALTQKRDAQAPEFTVAGNGKQVRDLLHADDVVALYRTATRAPAAFGQAFNIGGGMANSMSILEYLGWLSRHLDVDLRKVHLAPRQSDQLVFVADITHVREILGWSPNTASQTGLETFVNWVRQN